MSAEEFATFETKDGWIDDDDDDVEEDSMTNGKKHYLWLKKKLGICTIIPIHLFWIHKIYSEKDLTEGSVDIWWI